MHNSKIAHGHTDEMDILLHVLRLIKRRRNEAQVFTFYQNQGSRGELCQLRQKCRFQFRQNNNRMEN